MAANAHTGADTIDVPAGTSKDIVSLLHHQIARIMLQPDVKERLGTLGFYPVGSTPDEFASYIRRDLAKWAKVVRDVGIQPE